MFIKIIIYCTCYHRNKAKLSSGPPDHTPRQHDDATPPAPSATRVGSESSEDEGVATANNGRKRKGKAKSKKKPTKVSSLYTGILVMQ